MALNCSFPKSRRLRKRADYLVVQRGGKTQHCRYFVVVSEKQAKEHKSGRLGITVSKKVGNAVTRNRVKRVVREFARRSAAVAGFNARENSWLPDDLDVVVIAKKEAATATSATLWSALESCRDGLQRESVKC